MKVYFGGSVSGKEHYLQNYIKIVETLKDLGHEVLYRNIFNITPEEVINQSIEEKVKVHDKLGALKIESDIVLIECSYKSFGLGQEIAHAFRIGKPVLALYTDGHFPHLILSDAGDRLLISEYTLDNLKGKLIEAFEYLDPRQTKRFTMNIPASIVEYLDNIQRTKNVSKSDFVRELILTELQKDRNKKT